MSAREYARHRIRDGAMYLAIRGESAASIRATLRELAATESEFAIAWAEKRDRGLSIEDRSDTSRASQGGRR